MSSTITTSSTSAAEKTSQSQIPSSTLPISSKKPMSAPTTGFVPVIPTDKLVEADTSTPISQTTLTPSPSKVNVTAPIHHLNSSSGTNHMVLNATTPAFIRDHSGDIHSTTKDVTISTDPSSTSSIGTAPLVDGTPTTVIPGVTSGDGEPSKLMLLYWTRCN